MDYDYEVITDEDVQREGIAALKPYTVVLTGTHPEYVSEELMDATEDYAAAGGRLIYLGVTATTGTFPTDRTNPGVSKCASSTRACAPGKQGRANII